MQAKREFNWSAGIFLITYQSLLLLSLPFYLYYSLPATGIVLTSIILLYLTGLSITAGYHRLYSHRAYRAHPVVEFAILFLSAMTFQTSALRWAFDHRLHHAYVDTDEDPYSIKKGFWYAHFLWMLEKPLEIDPKVVSDLLKNRMVVFQHKYIKPLMFLSNFLVFLFVGWLFEDYLGAFMIAVCTRLFVLHHFTWFINSLAHTWGDKPFCQEQTAVDNYFLSLLTFGEGYHNYHHTFANDYRNGTRWFHFDPTKWLIWTLSKLGLTYDLKRMSKSVIKKKMVMERKSLLLEQLKSSYSTVREEWERRVNEISDRIVRNISDFNQLKEQYYQMKHSATHVNLEPLKNDIKAMRRNLQMDWKEWGDLSRSILNGNLEMQT